MMTKTGFKTSPQPWRADEDAGVVLDAAGGVIASPRRFDDLAMLAAGPALRDMLKECADYLSCIPESAAGGDDAAIALTRRARALMARLEDGA